MDRRRIGIIGAGAMGSFFGASLAQYGHEVVFVDSNPNVTEQINSAGVSIRGVRAFTASGICATVPRASQRTSCDLIFMFVKGLHTRQAIDDAAVSGLLDPGTCVVTLQNGWGAADMLCERGVDPDQIVVGVTYHSATVLAPGQTEVSGLGLTVVGSWSSAVNSQDRAANVADLLATLGWRVEASSEILTEIWKKLVLNAAVLPTAALTGLACDGLVSNAHAREVMTVAMRETTAVGRALGFDIDVEERIAVVFDVLRNAGAGKPSMLQDHLTGRPCEIETINGAVFRKAMEAGLAVPVNETLYRLVSAAEFARTRVARPSVTSENISK